jgi:hypothetical protein
MKKIYIACLTLSALSMTMAHPAMAQSAGLTRQQVAAETEVFLAVHDWDSLNSVWTVKPEFELPKALAAREAASALREQFLARNKWEDGLGTWAPIKGEARIFGQATSLQKQMEIDRFMLTHRFEEGSNSWISRTRTAG